jgi:hypothetical protein
MLIEVFETRRHRGVSGARGLFAGDGPFEWVAMTRSKGSRSGCDDTNE